MEVWNGQRKIIQEVRVIALKENTGFCGGVNAGIRESKSEYVLLLNNDTIDISGIYYRTGSCNRTGTGYLFMSGENASDSG